MKAVVYSSFPVGDTGEIPKYNAAHFPCHAENVDTVYLNGDYPEIKKVCEANGLTCKPFSEFAADSSVKSKSKSTKKD